MRIVDDELTEAYYEHEQKKRRFIQKTVLVVGIIILVMSGIFLWSLHDYETKRAECVSNPTQTFIEYSCEKPEECFEKCARDRSLLW
jgi:hypothetical protein